MTGSDQLIRELEEKADVIRRNAFTIFEGTESAGAQGHVGGTMSIIEIITALYFHHLKLNRDDPDWPQRDRLVLSKAHCCEAIYAALVEIGWYPKETLDTYYRFGSPFQGHADRWCTPGLEYSGGSLGQGLSYAAGLALAEKLKVAVFNEGPTEFTKKHSDQMLVKYNPTYRVYCILGDGECHEGQVWEAAMFAHRYKLDNLVAIVDYNKFSVMGASTEIMPLEPFVEKWKAFGFWVTEIDGHNLRQLVETLSLTNNLYGDGKPKCIIAHTVKGHGISRWEETHAHMPRGELVIEGLKEGREKYGYSE